jgi:glycosyltransferase involved in cell wall biosynthesis
VARGPDVTVVIPTRNRWDLLSTAALPAALGQEGVELEVVVVDDGSADQTAEELRTSFDARVRVVRHERPRGVARARNAGIEAARAKWVAFLDDDDLWAPEKLRVQLATAEARSASFAYGGAAAVTEDRSWLYSLAPPDPDALPSVLLERNVLWGGCSNVVVRTDVVRALGGFDERLFQLADWDLWIRLSHAVPGCAWPEVLVACIEHRRSMLLTTLENVFVEFEYLEAKHRAAREAAGLRLDRRTFTRWVALGHRRAGRRLRAARIYVAGAIRDRDPLNLARAVAAPLGERPLQWARLLWRRSGTSGPSDFPSEPAWLARYRELARRNDHAMSKATSPSER